LLLLPLLLLLCPLSYGRFLTVWEKRWGGGSQRVGRVVLCSFLFIFSSFPLSHQEIHAGFLFLSTKKDFSYFLDQ